MRKRRHSSDALELTHRSGSVSRSGSGKPDCSGHCCADVRFGHRTARGGGAEGDRHPAPRPGPPRHLRGPSPPFPRSGPPMRPCFVCSRKSSTSVRLVGRMADAAEQLGAAAAAPLAPRARCNSSHAVACPHHAVPALLCTARRAAAAERTLARSVAPRRAAAPLVWAASCRRSER